MIIYQRDLNTLNDFKEFASKPVSGVCFPETYNITGYVLHLKKPNSFMWSYWSRKEKWSN